MHCEKGHQMSTVIGVGLWQASCECGVFTVSLSGKNCSLRLTPLAPDGAVCPAHQTYFEADGTCAIVGCEYTRPAGKA